MDNNDYILVVDDDELLCRLLRMLLEDRGYPVLLAHSGQLAIEHVENLGSHIKLVILDVTLPDQNGFEVLKVLRTLQAQLPVLFLSGCDIEELMHTAGLKSPLCAHQHKPFDHWELLATVARLLATHDPVPA